MFFEDAGDWKGKLANVQITWTGPWSMQGRLQQEQPVDNPLIVMMG